MVLEHVLNTVGDTICFQAAVQLMDDDIRETLHTEMAPCPAQTFYDAYCERHYEKHGETFVCNTGGW